MRKPPNNPKCPLCGYNFDSRHVEIGVPFYCPICGRPLQVDTRQSRPHRSLLGFVLSSHSVMAVATSYLLCYLAGARGDTLLVAGAILTVIVHHGLAYWESNFAPLMIEPYPEVEKAHRRIKRDALLVKQAEDSSLEEQQRFGTGGGPPFYV